MWIINFDKAFRADANGEILQRARFYEIAGDLLVQTEFCKHGVRGRASTIAILSRHRPISGPALICRRLFFREPLVSKFCYARWINCRATMKILFLLNIAVHARGIFSGKLFSRYMLSLVFIKCCQNIKKNVVLKLLAEVTPLDTAYRFKNNSAMGPLKIRIWALRMWIVNMNGILYTLLYTLSEIS